MTTYRKIHGRAIKSVSSNLSAPSAEGQIWFNTTDNKFKSVVISEAWSSSAPLATARDDATGSGTQTDGLMAGGFTTTAVTTTEEYNGSGWSTGGNLGTARYLMAGGGPSTAGLAFGGYVSPNRKGETEEYNGTSWSEQSDLNTARGWIQGTGTQTAGLCVTGSVGGTPPATTAVEEYNGSSWTTVNAHPAERFYMPATGPQTAALATGGRIGPSGTSLTTSAAYDGTNWTSGATMNVGRQAHAASGPNTAALVFAGNAPPGLNSSESYDGSTFSTSGTLATARNNLSGSVNGSNTSALAFGGELPNNTNTAVTEEFNKSASVITAGAWASGGSLSTARQDGASFGVQTSAVIFGGEQGPPGNTNATEHYDGTSFSSGGNYTNSYTRIGAFGVLTAGVGYGGGNPYGNTNTSEYNGSAWTTVNAYPISVASSRGCGVLTAGLSCGGDTFPPAPTRNSNTAKEYDGTNWTSGGNLGTGGYAGMAAGTQTAAVFVGGTGRNALTEEYDGSSWTAGGASIINMSFGGSSSAGTQDSMTTFATNSSPYAFVQRYNGTAMATDPPITTARYSGTGAGTAPASLAMGGRAPPFSTAVEEFTAETTALNVKDLTQS